MTLPPGVTIRGELWTVEQCCRYYGKDRGQPLSHGTFFSYVRKGLAPEPLPWSPPGSRARLWDSVDVIEAYEARPGSGRSADPEGWVAVRATPTGREFWRGPQHQRTATTATLRLAYTWKSLGLVQKALTAVFGPGDRWRQPKWDGWVPVRRAGAALLDQAATVNLSDRHLLVLRRRAEGATNQTIGDELGVTRERVRQIEAEALKALAKTDDQ